MPGTTTLAACVMAAFSLSALLAQSPDPPLHYRYRTAAESDKKTAIAACDAHSTAPTNQAMLNAAQAMGATQMDTAICWLRIAAEQGDSTAQGTLATIYYTGLNGVPVNLNQALSFAIRAAHGNNYLGDNCLSLMYANGTGLEKDQAKADFWRRAAERDELAAKQAKQNPAPKQTSPQSAPAYGPNGPQPSDSAQDEPYGPNGPLPIPQVLHFCAAHCLTFTLEKDGKLHNYTNLPGQNNEHRILAVQKFTQKEVVIHRTDYGSYPGDGMMRGRMGTGNIATGENWAISWGDDLGRLPPDEAGLAIARGQQPGQDDSMRLLLLLLGAFGSDSSTESSRPKGSGIGCAPGTYNYNCYHQ